MQRLRIVSLIAFPLLLLAAADIALASDLFILATGRRDPRICAIDFSAAVKRQENSRPPRADRDGAGPSGARVSCLPRAFRLADSAPGGSFRSSRSAVRLLAEPRVPGLGPRQRREDLPFFGKRGHQ